MAISTRGNGPSMFDVSTMMQHLTRTYLVSFSVVMEPRAQLQDGWNLRIVAQRIPRTPTEHLNVATGIPNAVTWESRWADKGLYDMPSTLYRALWELEIALIEMCEQLALPA